MFDADDSSYPEEKKNGFTFSAANEGVRISVNCGGVIQLIDYVRFCERLFLGLQRAILLGFNMFLFCFWVLLLKSLNGAVELHPKFYD